MLTAKRKETKVEEKLPISQKIIVACDMHFTLLKTHLPEPKTEKDEENEDFLLIVDVIDKELIQEVSEKVPDVIVDPRFRNLVRNNPKLLWAGVTKDGCTGRGINVFKHLGVSAPYVLAVEQGFFCDMENVRWNITPEALAKKKWRIC